MKVKLLILFLFYFEIIFCQVVPIGKLTKADVQKAIYDNDSISGNLEVMEMLNMICR